MRIHPRALVLLAIAVVVLLAFGATAFVDGITGPDAERAWQTFLVNFLFWSGIAQAGPVFAAIYFVSKARWGGPVKNLAEGLGFFLPLSLGLFFVLMFGQHSLFPPLGGLDRAKQVWLDAEFLFLRDTIGLSVLYGLSLWFLYHSLRSGAPLGRSARNDLPSQRGGRALGILAPFLLFVYGIVFSLIGFDLVMSLDPEWYSTLFGAYFFISNLYLGFAVIGLTTVVVRKLLRLEDVVDKEQLSDLGKLVFAFCLLTGYFLWSQYLVIWYGNLPEETEFFILRMKTEQWVPAAWAVFFLVFVVPFFALLTRRVKRNPTLLFLVTLAIAVGMWLERYLLVVPSVDPSQGVVLGWTDLMITGGFFAMVLIAYTVFLYLLPAPAKPGAQA